MVPAAVALLLQSAVWATTISGSSEELVVNNPPEGVITIKIASPDGEVFTSDELIIRPSESGFADGNYKYELMGELSETAQNSSANSNLENNGRSGNVTLLTPVGEIESGAFRIVNGIVIDARTLKEK
jgi:hypothetical protein